MVRSYFVFNGTDSRTLGIYLRQAVPLIRPEERIKHVTIPGMAGDLTEKEGEEVYEPYIQTVEISVPGANKAAALSWLKGDGQVTFHSDASRRQSARVIGAVTLKKVSRNIDRWAGQVQFYCQPLKEALTTESDITVSASPGALTNPGDVKSKPLITVNGSGSITLLIGGQTLVLTGWQTGWKIDAATGWILDAGGNPKYGVCTGSPEKIRLPAGSSAAQWTGSVNSLVIKPRWRYL